MAKKYEAIYICKYPGCSGKPFTKIIGRTGGGIDAHGRNIACVSSQVKCPECGNFLKTWEDAQDIKEIKSGA